MPSNWRGEVIDKLLADELAARQRTRAASEKAAPVIGALLVLALVVTAALAWAFTDWFTPRATHAVEATNTMVQAVNATLSGGSNDAP